MSHGSGWPGLFGSAFRQSRNAMLLLDERRLVVDANGAMWSLIGRTPAALRGHPVAGIVDDGPLATEAEWQSWMAAGRFDGVATLIHADGTPITVQWAATTERATGLRLTLVVALHTSRWGQHFRRSPDGRTEPRALSKREREIVRLIALGATGPEIASELGIGHETVRTHVSNAMDKLHARSRAHLVAKALSENLLAD